MKNKPKVLIDTTDLKIFKIIYDRDNDGDLINIGQLKEKIGITHVNLLTHLRRLERYDLIYFNKVGTEKLLSVEDYPFDVPFFKKLMKEANTHRLSKEVTT